MEKQVVLILLSVSILMLPIAAIEPVQASGLLAYAETYAKAPYAAAVFNSSGVCPSRAVSSAFSSSSWGTAKAWADINVWTDPQGDIRGPFGPGPKFQGRLLMSVAKSGESNFTAWYDPTGDFYLDIPKYGITIAQRGSSYKNSSLRILVKDTTGILYDVGVIWGNHGGGQGVFYSVIENVGKWPQAWRDTTDAFTWRREQPPFSKKFVTTGAANLTFTMKGHIASSQEDSIKATIGIGSVGGIYVPVDKLALLVPYIALASTIIAATAATAIYVKRRKKKR